MALFFVGYLISVTSTIAFIVAILTPRWIYPNNSTTDPPSPLDTNYRGIFFVDTNYGNDTCRDWVLLYKNSVSICRKDYTIACASLSIAASSLSVILLWFAGGYLYIRRRRLVPNFVSVIVGLTLFIFLISCTVWVVMLVANRDPNLKLRRENVGFSLWIAVGASGGYLLAFISFLIYRFTLKRRELYNGTNKNSGRF